MGIETERFNTHSLLAIRRSFLESSKLEVPIWHLQFFNLYSSIISLKNYPPPPLLISKDSRLLDSD
jgi:hypothetical protein